MLPQAITSGVAPVSMARSFQVPDEEAIALPRTGEPLRSLTGQRASPLRKVRYPPTFAVPRLDVQSGASHPASLKGVRKNSIFNNEYDESQCGKQGNLNLAKDKRESQYCIVISYPSTALQSQGDRADPICMSLNAAALSPVQQPSNI